MLVKNSRIMVLGGWGLVGMAICHKLMAYSPSALIVTSLRKEEAESAVNQLKDEYGSQSSTEFIPKWGNIFTRNDWKDINWHTLINDESKRLEIIHDIFDEFDDKMLEQSALFNLISEAKPDIIIDCINTATAIAYLNIYQSAAFVIDELEKGNLNRVTVEKFLTSSYIPQLIRHIQILNKSMTANSVKMYLKVGTSGTGGMGMNIPYTHSEERPSRVLLSKAAVAGAQTLLLFILARTPGGPIIKEIKPTAAIAWKRIAYDTVTKGGQPIQLVDMKPNNAKNINDAFIFDDFEGVEETSEVYKSAFIDTGENGIFSRGEFQAISSIGQMEIITPEEIADYVVFEVNGGNSGHDIIQGLDSFSLGPTYRGGMLQHFAIEKIKQIELKHNTESVAFELLGPPRLSKLLFEINLIKRIAGTFEDALLFKPEDLANEANKLIQSDNKLRSEMLSIGLVILLPDGNSYLRGKNVKIPVRRTSDKLPMTDENIEQWCYEGWVDLRPSNFQIWLERLARIKSQAEAIPEEETSSRFTYTKEYWNNFQQIEEGKIAAWIFEFEDAGWRFKR